MSVLRAEVGALRRRVVLRGSNILDGRAIAQDLEQVLPRFPLPLTHADVCWRMLTYADDDLEQGLASAKEALLVAGHREKAVVAIDPGNPCAIMTLSYLQNTLQHVFAHDALVLFALVAASAGRAYRYSRCLLSARLLRLLPL
jgi:hypothetical protein